MNIDFDFVFGKLPHFATYIGITLKISILAMVATLVMSMVFSVIRYNKVPVLTQIINVYIDIFRGTPVLTQLFFIYYGLPQIFPVFKTVPAFAAAVIGLALNASAYTTENIRSALEAVPKGQTEGGLAVGMTNLQVMRYIVLPQATRIAIPVLSNDFIALIKNSSMAFTLGVRELMAEVQLIGITSFKYFEGYLDAMILYFVLCKAINILQKQVEKYFAEKGGVIK